MNTYFSIRTMIIGLLLVAMIVAGRLALYFYGNAVEAGEQVKQQNKTLAQQQSLITALRENAARNGSLMAEQQQREQQLRQQSEIYQRKYQDAIKNNKCAAERMPDAVLELLRGADTNAASANRSVTP